MSVDQTDGRKEAIAGFLNGESGLTISIPQLPDKAEWREPYLSRTKALMGLYDRTFRSIDSEARSVLKDVVRTPAHIFLQQYRDKERVVAQLKQGGYGGKNDHLFAEFISTRSETEELASRSTQTLAQRLHAIIDYFFPGEMEKTFKIPDPEPVPIVQGQPIVARLITVPTMDETVVDDEGNQYLFNRDLAKWWKQFFGNPTAGSERFLANLPAESRRLTAWMFHYDSSGSISTLEYLRRNFQKPGLFGREEGTSEGMKLVPQNSAGFQNKHSQILNINLETGNVTNTFDGIALHGKKQPITFEYVLFNGMLDQKGVRFDQPRWSFDQVVSDILGDIPIDMEASSNQA